MGLLPAEALDVKSHEQGLEIRVETVQPERLVPPLRVAEAVERAVAGLRLAGGFFRKGQAGEHLEVEGGILQRREPRDPEIGHRLGEPAGPVGRLTAAQRDGTGILLSARGGRQDEEQRRRGRPAGEASHSAMLSRENSRLGGPAAKNAGVKIRPYGPSDGSPFPASTAARRARPTE